MFLKFQHLTDLKTIIDNILPTDVLELSSSKTDYDLNQITSRSLSTLLSSISSPFLIILAPVLYFSSCVGSIYFSFMAIKGTFNKLRTLCNTKIHSSQVRRKKDYITACKRQISSIDSNR